MITAESEWAMDDCVHLKACRRIMKIARSKGFVFGRGCNENCSAYEEAPDGMFTREQVEAVKCGACLDGHEGYYPGDLIIEDYVMGG